MARWHGWIRIALMGAALSYGALSSGHALAQTPEDSPEDAPETVAPTPVRSGNIGEAINKQILQIEQLLQDEERISGYLRNLRRLATERRQLEEKIGRETIVIARLDALMGVLRDQVAMRSKKVLELAPARMMETSQTILLDLANQTNDPVLRDIRLAQAEQTVVAFRDSLIQYISPKEVDRLAKQDFDIALDWYLKVQYTLVEPLLKDYVRAYPGTLNYDQAMLMLGDIYKYQSRFDEAVEIFRTLTTSETTANDVKMLSYAILEDIYYRQGRWDEALTAYYTVADQFLLYPEEYDGAIYIAGDAYFQKAVAGIEDREGPPAPLADRQAGLLDSAITVFGQVSDMSPLYILAQQSIAQCYIEQGKLDAAVGPLTNAETTQPPLWADDIIFESIWTATARLGHVYLELSRKAENPNEVTRYRDLAMEQYSKVPQDAEIYDEVILALAWLEIERNNTENGVRLLETLLDVRPDSEYAYEAWISLGDGYTKLKDYARAREVFSQLAITQRAITLIDSTVNETRDLDNIRRELQRLSMEVGSQMDMMTVNRVAAQLDSIAEKKFRMLELHQRLFETDPLALELVNYGQLKVTLASLSGLVAAERATLNSVTRDLGTIEQQTLASARYQDAVWKVRQDARDVQQTQAIANAFERDVEKGLSVLETEIPRGYTRWLKEAEFGKVNIDFTRYQSYKMSIKEQYELIGEIMEDLKALPEGSPIRSEVETMLADLRNQATAIETDLTDMRQGLIADLEQVLQRYPDSPSVEPVLFRLAYVQYDQTERDFLEASEAYAERLDRGEDAEEAPLPDYGRPIRTYERFIAQYPKSEVGDQAYFQLGHLLSEQGELVRSNQMFETLVQQYPNSPLVPDAYLRIGDFYFDALYLGLTDLGGEEVMQRAVAAYDRVLDYPDNRNYQNALYKLGWSYYNLAAPELREKEYDQSIAYFTALLEDSLRVARYNQLAKEAGIEPKQLDPGYDLTSEAIKYVAINFRDRVETGREEEARNWASRDVAGTMKRYIEQVGRDKPYAKPLMVGMADVYKETGQKEAEIVALDSLLALLPNDPQAPRILQRMIDGYEDLEQMAMADPTVWKKEDHGGQGIDVYLNRARERLFRDFGREWAETLPDSTARAEAMGLAERAGWRLANWVASQAEAGGAPASGIEEAAKYYRDYLEDFPESPNAYTARWNYAQYMWRLNRYEEAYQEFMTVSRDERFDKYREQAAINAILAAEKMLELEKAPAPSGSPAPQ